MTGADDAHYGRISQTSSRLVHFPDGVARYITMTNWHWEVLDRLHTEKGWDTSAIPAAALEAAHDYCSDPALFENQLRRSYRMLLEASMAYVMKPNDWTIANQRF